MLIPDFANTQNAFASYTNRDLRKAHFLFKFIRHPMNVSIGKFLLKMALAIHFPIRWMVKPTLFKQFCGGESLKECNQTVDAIRAQGAGSIPDYSAEGQGTEVHFDKVRDEVLKVIAFAEGRHEIPFCVFKPTGIISKVLLEKLRAGIALNENEREAYQRGRARFTDLCQSAANAGVRILIDAEETWIQAAIDSLTEEEMIRWNKEQPIVYNTVQMYRTDRLTYLMKCCEKLDAMNIIPGFKLVRGAYMEKERSRAAMLHYPSPIHSSKENTDRDYNKAIAFCIQRISNTGLCLGTHNEESTLLMTELMNAKGLDSLHPNLCFAQLLGMSDHITYNLAKAGYRAAKYVPYGPVRLVMPYLVRRAAENTSVAGQTSRELSLIKKELERRNKK